MSQLGCGPILSIVSPCFGQTAMKFGSKSLAQSPIRRPAVTLDLSMERQ
jgi:hypothetical protein